MNIPVKITLLTLATTATASTFLWVCPVKAETQKVRICRPTQKVRVVQDAADHPGAYRDGYREGEESASEGEAYEPRTAGGEFARGFEDGYYGRPFTGQQHEVSDRMETYTTQECDTVTIEED